MLRRCDGTDPNLTKSIPAEQFDPATMTTSHWTSTAGPGEVVVNCSCGLVFDDEKRTVVYPHDPV